MSTKYNTDQFELNYPINIDQHFWTRARSKIISRKIKTQPVEIKRWLEVGCGTGVVTKYLRSQGISVDGCELADVPKHLRKLDNLTFNQDATQLPLQIREQYDGILLLDVLEHVENRVEFLDQLSSSFPNVKQLILTVPARSELWTNYDEFYGHFLRYNLHDLEEEVSKTTWNVRHKQYIFHILYFVMLFVKVIRNNRKVDMSPSLAGSQRMIHYLAKSICEFDEILLPKKFLGSSVLSILERRS